MNTTGMAMMDMHTSHGLVSFEMFFCAMNTLKVQMRSRWTSYLLRQQMQVKQVPS